MSRYFYTAVAALLLTLLTASHWKAYTLGRTLKQAEFNEAVSAATERAREREQALIAAKQQAEVKYVQIKKRNEVAAAGARDGLYGLRSAIGERKASADSTAAPGTVGASGLEQELLGHCAGALVGLAAEADRLEALVVGLQGYVTNVCTAKQ